MNDTPTPRTDTTWDRMCCSGQPWYQIAEEMKFDCRQLETELAAVTEQRDGLRSAVDYASDQLTRVTEQRDRLAEALQKLNEYDLGDIPVGVVRRCEEALAAVKGGSDES